MLQLNPGPNSVLRPGLSPIPSPGPSVYAIVKGASIKFSEFIS